MRKIEMRRLRAYTVTALILLALSGSITHFSFGTFSSFGFDTFSAICPLGSLETTLASKIFVPRLFIGLGVSVLATILLGKVFCAWGCPIPFVQRWFSAKKRPNPDGSPTGPAPVVPLDTAHSMPGVEPGTPEARRTSDTRYFVLGGALLSSAIFGFPVFCLICPVGLFFGTLIAIMRLVRFNEPTITVLIFPAVLVIEVVLLRKWCSTFCPLGALIGLLSGFNKTVRPVINTTACLTANPGFSCLACKQICPEGIDLHEPHAGLANGDCTKCGDCLDVCPAKAITFHWREKYNADSK